ncbi:MAG: PSD1 and planctomycete cytochrome C domain-containing protein [Phycisphaeraceae bacterium]
MKTNRLILPAAAILCGLGAAAFAEPKVSFNRDIRPIVSDTCFQCHGPDEKERKAGLRLDVRETALKPTESGETPIVPGHPEKSEMMRRLTTTDKTDLMPPRKLNKPLTPAQIETVKKWIAQGAQYEGHWAFTKVERPALPDLDAAFRDAASALAFSRTSPQSLKAWSKNPIDQYILARMLPEGLTPAPQADKGTLIRRVSLDLTGLPPTPEEIDAFLADQSPQAYEKVVDRLLTSPRYGEHMALRWLDMARYADSNGFQVDSSRYQWPWRDWVIKAFNENMPFDQFTVEQIAGDMLEQGQGPGAKGQGAGSNSPPSQGGVRGGSGARPSGTAPAQQDLKNTVPPTLPQPLPKREGSTEHWISTSSLSRVVATGFNRNHKLNGEGGIIAEEWRIETVIDRVETTGMTWLALTFNCCRCHDHKFDPITQKEFYQFFAYFNNVPESGTLQGESRNTDPVVKVPVGETELEMQELQKQIAAADAKVIEAKKNLPALIAAWEPSFKKEIDSQKPAWNGLSPTSVKSIGGATFTRQEDGSYLASGANPANDTYEVIAPIAPGNFTGLLLECFIDPSLPVQSLGRYPNGNFVLTRVEATITAPSLKDPLTAKITKAVADYSQSGWDISFTLNGNKANGWAVDGPTKKENRKAMFLVDVPLTVPDNATITVRLFHEAINQHNIGRFRLAATSLPADAVTLEGVRFPESLKTIVATPADKRTDVQLAELEKFFIANVDSPIRRAAAEANSARAKIDSIKGTMATVMVMREGAVRKAFILGRGEYDKPGEAVTAGLPAALPPMPEGEPNNRLGLSAWIVSPTNPLTARVWVNRAWERFFGTGIVKTTENFGSQAEFPSHPALLDWLSAQFMQGDDHTSPWDMKAIQKLIVMSAAYQQSSRINSRSVELDPENRFLSRGPRFRLKGEVIRDQALFVSGLLVEKQGGPSVRPYMPKGVWDETSRYGDLRNYQHDKGDGLYRRTMYTIWKRTAAPPSMLIFDAPNREICTVTRSRTNTPLQALALLNEITYVEAARKLAERMLSETPAGKTGAALQAERVAYGFRLATSRKPSAQELRILINGLSQDMVRYKKAPAEAAKLLGVGESKADSKFDQADLAAFTMTANVLLNLDEVVTRE